MCKILVFTNMSKMKKIKETVETIAKNLSDYERDGFGYAIQGESGIFGERTTKPHSFESSWSKEVLRLNFTDNDFNRFGQKSKIVGAGIFHGRTSTNHKTLINTHPIIKNNWTLIHNGVVSNHGPEYEMQTTNDTEHLVHYMSTQGINAIEKNLTGYYAFATFDPDNKLHIVRDSIAPLFIGYIKKIDSYIIGTTKDLIKDTCKDLSLNVSHISAISDNYHIIFKGNNIESSTKISPRGRTSYESKFSSLSLGVKLDDTNEESNIVKFKVADDSNNYTDDENCFLTEVTDYIDSSYTILDFRNNYVSLSEFKKLSDDEKLEHTVIRSDGTIVSQYDYHTDKLYMG